MDPKTIREQHKNTSCPDVIYFSLDTAKGAATQTSSQQNAVEQGTDKDNNQATVGSCATSKETQQQSTSNGYLRVLTDTQLRVKARSAPPSPILSQKNEKDGEILSCIVPCISNFSMNLVMTSGSSENVNDAAPKQNIKQVKSSEQRRDTTTAFTQSSLFNGGLLKCSEPKGKFTEKAVSPRLMYGIKKNGSQLSGSGYLRMKSSERPKSVYPNSSSKNNTEARQEKSSLSLEVTNRPRRHSACELTAPNKHKYSDV